MLPVRPRRAAWTRLAPALLTIGLLCLLPGSASASHAPHKRHALTHRAERKVRHRVRRHVSARARVRCRAQSRHGWRCRWSGARDAQRCRGVYAVTHRRHRDPRWRVRAHDTRCRPSRAPGTSPPARGSRTGALSGTGPAAGQAAAQGDPAATRALPPQGVYEECGPAESGLATCLQRLDAIAGAGFKLVLNYTMWYSSAADIQAYAAEAQRLGVQIIWPLNAPAWRGDGSLTGTYRVLAQDCGCTDNPAFEQYAIGLTRDLPATWGYYVGDEVPASDEPAVASLAAQVKQLAPGLPQLFVSLENDTTDGHDIDAFSGVADVLGSDVYPVGSGDADPIGTVSTVASHLANVAAGSGRRTAMVLQSFSWSQYMSDLQHAPFPSEAQMRAMRDAALSADPSMILWYSYYDIARSDDPAGNLAALEQAAFGS